MHGHSAAMRSGHGRNDRQADPGALHVPRSSGGAADELAEDATALVARESRSVILHADADQPPLRRDLDRNR